MENLVKEIENFFKEVEFVENTHTYSVRSQNIKISVSGLIKQYKFPTNWNKVAEDTANRRNVSKEEIKKQWKESADKGCHTGTVSHSFGELYPFNRHLVPQTPYQKAIKRFWDELPSHIIPVLVEIRMYHKKYLFAGTADIILYNTITKKFIIADYKTNKDLFKNFRKQKMSGPFKHLLCCSFNHYQLQLSYYQLLLEQVIGKGNISHRKIIWIKPDATYVVYDTDDYSDILDTELKTKGIV